MTRASETTESIESAFANPSPDHLAETHGVAQEANARWERARAARLALAEQIADAAVFGGSLEPHALERYSELSEEQRRARVARTLAADELLRALSIAAARERLGSRS